MIKYPSIEVELCGEDGNAFSIMGKVTKAMRRARVSQTEITTYRNEAMAGDYDNLIALKSCEISYFLVRERHP